MKADQHKRFTLQKLKSLDLEVAQSIDLLQNLPDLYAELKPKVGTLDFVQIVLEGQFALRGQTRCFA